MFYHRASETERLEMQQRVVKNNASSFSALAQQLGIDLDTDSDDETDSEEENGVMKEGETGIYSQTPIDSEFSPAPAFKGMRSGFVFKMDRQGLGYYRSAPPEVTFAPSQPAGNKIDLLMGLCGANDDADDSDGDD